MSTSVAVPLLSMVAILERPRLPGTTDSITVTTRHWVSAGFSALGLRAMNIGIATKSAKPRMNDVFLIVERLYSDEL